MDFISILEGLSCLSMDYNWILKFNIKSSALIDLPSLSSNEALTNPPEVDCIVFSKI